MFECPRERERNRNEGRQPKPGEKVKVPLHRFFAPYSQDRNPCLRQRHVSMTMTRKLIQNSKRNVKSATVVQTLIPELWRQPGLHGEFQVSKAA